MVLGKFQQAFNNSKFKIQHLKFWFFRTTNRATLGETFKDLILSFEF